MSGDLNSLLYASVRHLLISSLISSAFYLPISIGSDYLSSFSISGGNMDSSSLISCANLCRLKYEKVESDTLSQRKSMNSYCFP